MTGPVYGVSMQGMDTGYIEAMDKDGPMSGGHGEHVTEYVRERNRE